jgi:dynein heavy chain
VLFSCAVRLLCVWQLIDDIDPESITSAPDAGCYIRGLYLEGARYDPSIKALNDSLPKQLYTLLPIIHLMPLKDRKSPTSHVYMCPVYKILSRQGTHCVALPRVRLLVHSPSFCMYLAGTLSTTGHSTNFVMFIELPSDRPSILNNRGMADCDVWIKAGVAAFCALRY